MLKSCSAFDVFLQNNDIVKPLDNLENNGQTMPTYEKLMIMWYDEYFMSYLTFLGLFALTWLTFGITYMPWDYVTPVNIDLDKVHWNDYLISGVWVGNWKNPATVVKPWQPKSRDANIEQSFRNHFL